MKTDSPLRHPLLALAAAFTLGAGAALAQGGPPTPGQPDKPAGPPPQPQEHHGDRDRQPPKPGQPGERGHDQHMKGPDHHQQGPPPQQQRGPQPGAQGQGPQSFHHRGMPPQGPQNFGQGGPQQGWGGPQGPQQGGFHGFCPQRGQMWQGPGPRFRGFGPQQGPPRFGGWQGPMWQGPGPRFRGFGPQQGPPGFGGGPQHFQRGQHHRGQGPVGPPQAQRGDSRGHRDQGGKPAMGPTMGGDPLQMMAQALGLTPEQKSKAEPLLDKTRARMKAIQEEAEQKMHAAMKEAHAQLEPLLTDEQKKKVKEMHQHMEHARASQHGREGEGKPGERHDMEGALERALERSISGLNLSPDQKQKVEGAMRETSKELREILINNNISREDQMAKMREMREKISARISPFLNDEQKKKLEEFKARHERGEHRTEGGGVRPRPEGQEVRPAEKPEPKPDAKPEPKADAKPEAKADDKPL